MGVTHTSATCRQVLSLCHCGPWLLVVSLCALSPAAASRRAAHTSQFGAEQVGWREGFTHRRAHLKNCTLYPPQLACVKGERKWKSTRSLPTNTQEGYSREKKRWRRFVARREMLHDTIFNCSWFCNAIHIHSVTHSPSAVWSGEQKLWAPLSFNNARLRLFKTRAFCRFSPT